MTSIDYTPIRCTQTRRLPLPQADCERHGRAQTPEATVLRMERQYIDWAEHG